jgi:hypothetical protein
MVDEDTLNREMRLNKQSVDKTLLDVSVELKFSSGE